MQHSVEISPELLQKVIQVGTLKRFGEGDVILQENAYVRSIPFVINGTIKVMKTEEDGREILLYYITAGESCVMSFLGGIHQDTSKIRAQVEEATEIVFLPIEKLSAFVRNHPEIIDYVLKLYHKRFEELLEMVNQVSFKRIDERLFSHLIKKSELTQTSVIVTTHEQLANELGTARVVISRILKSLEEQEKIKLGRGKIELL